MIYFNGLAINGPSSGRSSADAGVTGMENLDGLDRAPAPTGNMP